MTTQASSGSDCAAMPDALLREMLVRLGDRWTLRVLEALDGEGPTRFTRLRDALSGVSQKMLTKTLRQLERDGLVTRRVHPVVPPHVDYELTLLGTSLSAAVCGLWTWAESSVAAIERARRAYDHAGDG